MTMVNNGMTPSTNIINETANTTAQHSSNPSVNEKNHNLVVSQNDLQDEKQSIRDSQADARSEETIEQAVENPKIRPVDTAFGWIPTIACSINYMFIFGASNSYGVFSTYYLKEKFPDTSATTLSWIGTLITSLMLICTFFTGALCDAKGYRFTSYIGTIICGVAYILASFSKEVWHLILTQGMLLGIGSSFILAPSLAIPPQWFDKYRGLASGVAVAGSSVGGLWFTAATQTILDNLGDRWALRILGILTFVVTGIMNMFYYRRVPAKKRKRIMDISAIKHLSFWFISLEACTVYTGYWAPTFYIGTTATLRNGTLKDGSNLLLTLNAGSAVGRVLAGLIADHIGAINMLLISLVLAVVIEMPLWMKTTTIGPLYAMCILYGLASPTFISINPVLVSQYFDRELLATVMGTVNVFGGAGVLAGNLSQGEVFQKYDKREGFTNTIIFSGMFIVASAIITFAFRTYAISRFSSSKKFFQKI